MWPLLLTGRALWHDKNSRERGGSWAQKAQKGTKNVFLRYGAFRDFCGFRIVIA
jgi:hypothetical protein